MTTIVTLFQNRFGDKEPSPVSRNDEKITLYVVVDQEKIKTTEVVKTPVLQTHDPEASRSVKYSILQIIPFVNNKDVLRYLLLMLKFVLNRGFGRNRPHSRHFLLLVIAECTP